MATRNEEVFSCDDWDRMDKRLSTILETPGHDDISVKFTGHVTIDKGPDGDDINTPKVYMNDFNVMDWEPESTSFSGVKINGNYLPVAGWFVLSYLRGEEL